MTIEAGLILSSGFLSVVGAVVIALPDTPRLRLILWSERVREGLYEMEANGLTENEIGYKEIGILLEEIYGIDILSNSWAYRIGIHTMSRYGFETVYLFTNKQNEESQVPLGKKLGKEVDYRVARSEIRRRINNYQAAVRATGFILLAFSFGLQTVGYLV